MQMLMAIEMRDAQPGGQHLLDLRPQLRFDVAAWREEKAEVISRHRRAGGQRSLFNQSEMDAHFERRRFKQSGHRVVELLSIRHDRTRRHDAMAVRLDGAGGYPPIESDI